MIGQSVTAGHDKRLTLARCAWGEWRDGLPLIGHTTFQSHMLGAEVSLEWLYELTSLEAALPGECPEQPGR